KTPPSKKNNNKSNLIEFLIDNNYIDTQKYAFDKHTEHTWQRNASSSRIDFIWVDNNIFDKITKINKPYIPNYKTDHKCLSIDLNIKIKNWKTTSNIERYVYNWENTKQINNYKKKTNKLAAKINENKSILNNIESLWSLIKYNLIKAKELNKERMTQIKKSIEARNEDFFTNQKKFYNNILNKNKNNIKIDRIIENDMIITNPNMIKEKIENHFYNYFKHNELPDITEDNEFWKILQPKNTHKEILLNILDKPKEEEWIPIIKHLPSKKAHGPSNISYEHIKHAHYNMQKLIIHLISLCYKSNNIPEEWKTSHIYPIPKREDWGYNINIIRPIAIIEPVKKLMTKILTIRMEKLIREHNILKGYNFAAQKHSSPQIPIQIINNTIEHCRDTKSETWIMFQDMSRAFDNVNIERLIITLKRIDLPENFINLIKNIHTGRKAKIITPFGLTNPISIESGIEQGETYSPLLWKLYYDPILQYIQENAHNNLLTIHSKSPSETLHQKSQTTITIPPLAFVDDVSWIANSRSAMKNILEITQRYNILNNIQVNLKKSDLLILNSTHDDLTLNNDQTISVTKNKPIRYLGVYYDNKGSSKPTFEKIVEKIKIFTNIIKYKKLTYKQLFKVYNTTLKSSIEYLIQIITLNNKEISTINNLIRKIFKSKLNFPKNIHNDTIQNFMLENVQPIEDIFLITNTRILYDIIHSNFSLLKSLIDIRIKDWKRTGWFHNIDIETFRKFSKDTKNNMVASIITELAKNNLIIKNPNNSYLGTEHPNFTDIHKTVDYKIFTKNKKAFKQHNIIFLEQITTHDNRNILPWNKIYIRKFGTNKARKEPKWFQNITTKFN
ncbi:13259_t:CDS:2, partial [Entrophospora sp. SA101]